MTGNDPQTRALRLDALMPVLAAVDGWPDEYTEPRCAPGVVTQALVSCCTPEDFALARACLDVERDVRRWDEWAALEFLLGAVQPGAGLDSIYSLPPNEQLPALRAAAACGWLGGI